MMTHPRFLSYLLSMCISSILILPGCGSDDGGTGGDPGDDDSSSDDSSSSSPEPEVLYPVDGTWSGNGISFTVSGGGTEINITYADFGSCSGYGYCTASSTCSACSTSINNDIGQATFSEGDMGCSGSFDSTTTASGTCTYANADCGCTMTHSWTATPS